MMVILAMMGILLAMNLRNNGVTGPRVGQYLSGWKISSEQP
jgi:hypothetical protein